MNMKKLISLALALVMLLAMSATAMAYTVSAPDNGHSYEVYQIFVGDLSEDGKVLSNIKWGKNGTGTENSAVSTEILTEIESVVGNTDVEKLAVIMKYANLDTTVYGEVGVIGEEPKYVKELTNVPAGYYLIKDKADSLQGEHDAYTLYIVKIVNDVEISPKGDVPTVDKEIVGGTTTETGDYNIGDVINYKITGTLPSNYADYKEYKYVFHDSLTAGLTYTKGNAKVYVVNGTNKADVTSSFTETFDAQKLTLTCNDLKKIANVEITASSQIVVEYTATLNDNAIVGGAGNPNEVYLEFSNDPNHSGEGTPTGDTPKDKVVVFTFELDVTKVDGEDLQKKLKDAKFVLRNENNEWVTVDENGKVTGWTSTKDNGSELTSDENGFFKISGLEDGTYYLEEIKAPDGYNLLPNEITIIITATYDEDGVKTLTIKVGNENAVSGNTNTGIVEATVHNNKGATLPETGAQGTKMIYMVGGILVAAAAILLITKRRMNAAE